MCVWTEMDFSRGAAREQCRQNTRATVGATRVPLEGKQRRGLLQGMIIEWNRDWIGSSCHCQTHRQVDDSSPRAPRVLLVRRKQPVRIGSVRFAFKASCSEQVGYDCTLDSHIFIQLKLPHAILPFPCKYADAHTNWSFQLSTSMRTHNLPNSHSEQKQKREWEPFQF